MKIEQTALMLRETAVILQVMRFATQTARAGWILIVLVIPVRIEEIAKLASHVQMTLIAVAGSARTRNVRRHHVMII